MPLPAGLVLEAALHLCPSRFDRLFRQRAPLRTAREEPPAARGVVSVSPRTRQSAIPRSRSNLDGLIWRDAQDAAIIGLAGINDDIQVLIGAEGQRTDAPLA